VSKGPALSCLNRTYVTFQGKQYLFFGGNDYHRLASHPEVVAACRREAESGGLSCSGSRITTGNHPLLDSLEKKLADFLDAEEVTVCSDGYVSNTVVLETLADDRQRIFLDSATHVSMSSPARCLFPERVHDFHHAEPDDLARQVRARLRPGERPLVLTDGVGSSDGSLSPLRAYWESIKEHGGLLVVDDAHGIGTVGVAGKGSPAAADLPAAAYVQTATLSKALGAFGGLAAGPAWLAARVPERSNAYMAATPIPPPLAAAGISSLEILRRQPSMISGLQERTASVRRRLNAMGFATGGSPAPIVSITHGNAESNERLRVNLLECGLFVPLVRGYPGSPPGGHLRLTLSSVHAEEDIERLLEAIARCCD
jgi:7-keto-8-aminopelargonate synthetase-like enzyme